MGILYGIIGLPALEADDITKAAQDETAKTMGTSTGASGVSDTSEDDDGEDLSKTDNIFGKNSKADKIADGKSPDAPDDNDSDSGPEDITEDAQNETNDTAGDMDSDDNDLDSTDDSTDDVDSGDQTSVQMKDQLKENMVYMHSIVCNNINLLTKYITEISSQDEAKIVHNIMTNLNKCKDILYDEITEGFTSKPYHVLMKTYVGVNRVYDICLLMLNEHCSSVELSYRESDKKYKKSKKSKKK